MIYKVFSFFQVVSRISEQLTVAPEYLTEFIQIPDFWTQILSLIFVPWFLRFIKVWTFFWVQIIGI